MANSKYNCYSLHDTVRFNFTLMLYCTCKGYKLPPLLLNLYQYLFRREYVMNRAKYTKFTLCCWFICKTNCIKPNGDLYDTFHIGQGTISVNFQNAYMYLCSKLTRISQWTCGLVNIIFDCTSKCFARHTTPKINLNQNLAFWNILQFCRRLNSIKNISWFGNANIFHNHSNRYFQTVTEYLPQMINNLN